MIDEALRSCGTGIIHSKRDYIVHKSLPHLVYRGHLVRVLLRGMTLSLTIECEISLESWDSVSPLPSRRGYILATIKGLRLRNARIKFNRSLTCGR